MSEAEAIASRKIPVTRSSLAKELSALGIRAGDTLMVHSSLRRIGWVAGGPVAVVQALMDVLGPSGTLVMPTHSTDYSDPSHWQSPPVPSNWWQTIRDHMPAYHPDFTPTREMGAVAECFRTFPEVRRSSHPTCSFAAWGRKAAFVTEKHGLDFPLGEGSPLARVYELDGGVLLIGVEHDRNTSFHLSEARAGSRKVLNQGAPIYVEGFRDWKPYKDYESDVELFLAMGADFALSGRQIEARLGNAPTSYMRQVTLVDFGVEWLKTKIAANPPNVIKLGD